MKPPRLFQYLVLNFLLSSLVIGQEGGRPNTIGPASKSTVGAIRGSIYSVIGYQNTRPVPGAKVAAVSMTLDKVYSDVKADSNGDFFLPNVPSGVPVKICAWNPLSKDALSSLETELNKGEIKDHDFSWSSSRGSYATDAAARSISSRSIIEQIEFLLDGAKNRFKSFRAPWADGIPHETDHYRRLSSDIESLEFRNDNGVNMEMYAPFNMRESQVLYNQIFEGLDGLEMYHSRKSKYKTALYQIAFGDGLENFDNLALYNGCTTMETIDQVFDFLEDIQDVDEVAVAMNEILKAINDLKYVSSVGAGRELSKLFGTIGNVSSMKEMNHLGKCIVGLDMVINIVNIGETAWKTFYLPKLIEAAKYDLAVMRLKYLAQYDIIDDVAYIKALEEVLEGYETIPDDYWEKVKDFADRNQAKIEQGVASTAELWADVQILTGKAGGHWAGAIIFTFQKVREIQAWNDQFRIMICLANIYGNYLDKVDQNSWIARDIIEYCEFGYYNLFVSCLRDKAFRRFILELGSEVTSFLTNTNSRKDVREYMQEERGKILEEITKNRVQWYVNTFDIGNSKSSEDIVIGLILDSSGSMSFSDPSNIRVTASQGIVDILRGTENVYVIDFDNTATWRNRENFKNWNSDQLKSEIGLVDAAGGTNIGAGLNALKAAIESTTMGRPKAGVILLSDGKSPYPANLTWFSDRDIPIYTVSYKQFADAALLSKISGVTGGVYISASNEGEVVRAFQSFYNDMFDSNKLVSCSDKVKAGESISLCSFNIDPDSKELIGTLSWQNGDMDLVLKSPDGKEYSQDLTPGKLIRGNNYAIVRIDQPKAGSWTAQATNKGRGISYAEFIFEVSGSSSLKISLEKKSEQGFISYALKESAGKLNLADIMPIITIETPDKQLFDISGNYASGNFQYLPAQGMGTYTTKVSFTAKLTTGELIQRYFIVSDYIGKYIPPFISSPSSLDGDIMKAPLGTKVGNYVGMRCYIYKPGGNKNSPKAIGMVTMVQDDQCNIEILQHVSPEPISVSDIIELDQWQWQHDKTIRLN